jgi:hypothetical protein
MRAACRWSSIAVLLILASIFSGARISAQQKNPWDSAIESLAAKIAAITGAHGSVRLSVRNLTSLDTSRVADFTAALEAQLRQRGLRVENGSSGGETIDATISENLRDIIFAAEIKRGDARELAIETLERVKAEARSDAQRQVRLQRDWVYAQHERFLDFLVWTSPADAARRLIVLEPRRLVIYRSAADGWQALESHPLLDLPARRDPLGFLNLGKDDSGATLEVLLPGERCTASLAGALTLNCAYDARPVVDLERESAAVGNVCGAEGLRLASGSGDWTQPDTLSAVDGASGDTAGDSLAFSGPILVLRPGVEEKSARVIWRDLVTGDYEGGIVTVACGD